MNRCKHVWKKPEEGDVFKRCSRCAKRKKLFPKVKKKALKALCDKEWSRITKIAHIKKYGKICLWCLEHKDNLQSDHIFNRWKHSTRWNVHNCVVICYPCHFYRKKQDPLGWAKMVQANVAPEKLFHLEYLSNQLIQPDYDEILAYLKNCEQEILSEGPPPPKESRYLDTVLDRDI